MTRLEIIANQAIEEDIIEALKQHGYGENFTYLAPVSGRGRHGRREGSAVWPEENVLFIVVIEDDQMAALVDALRKVKADFSGEGFRCYIQQNVEKLI